MLTISTCAGVHKEQDFLKIIVTPSAKLSSSYIIKYILYQRGIGSHNSLVFFLSARKCD